MASVTFPPSVGGDGSTVTDDNNPITGLGNGGHRTRFVPTLSQTVAVAANTVTKATEASASASSASNWATKTDNFVSGSDNSAKSWAIGGTGFGDPTAGSAKDWATQTTGNVDGTEFSSKEYAVGTNIRGVSGRGSAKDWATYTAGMVDGVEYSAKKYAQDAGLSFDSFDKRYLGAKASDPALDNSGNSLVVGAIYFNTVSNQWKVWTGSAWALGTFVPGTAGSISFAPTGTLVSTDVQAAITEVSESLLQVKSSNYTAVSGDRLAVNTSSGPVTITLPANPVVGSSKVTISDYNGTFATNALTVARNGKLIQGLAENMTADANYSVFKLVYIDNTKGWVIYE